MQIGFVGLGVMGSRMLRHLVAAGHNATIYDIDLATRDRVAAETRATAADSPRAVAAASEIVVTMLPNGYVVRDVAFGDGGLAEGFRPGALLLDTSSAEPWITREIAEKLAAQNVDMVDAPVSGAEEGARTATLVFMVGGSDAAVARAQPLLALMGREIFHLGPLGAGHTMKTINNLATALTFLGTAEALMIGKSYGLNAKAMVDVLNVSTGYSFVSQKRLGSDVITRKFADQFKLDLMLKDMGIANQLAAERELPVPMSVLGRDLWRRAVEELGEGSVTTEIVRWYERQMGFELKDES
jgi:3-hydroxyisobutyrate dehydrogenase-like beta-hydroxyacid dehydrogenase